MKQERFLACRIDQLHPFDRRPASGDGGLIRRILSLLVLFFAIGVWPLAAQTSSVESGQPDRETLTLQLFPENTTLWGRESTQRFLLLATGSDGLVRDLTSQAEFSVSNPHLAELSSQGQLTSRSNGEVVLAARFQDRTVTTRVQIEGTEQTVPFTFAWEINGILTKRRCNAQECHGSVKGKGGLKLSMNGLYPREDYEWIVQGGDYQVLSPEPAGDRAPRVDRKEPRKSLLLAKPAMQIPHGGGRLLEADSADYRRLLRWVKAGAPYQEEESPVSVRRIEVFPPEAFLEPGASHQLLVFAYLANGQRQDITDQVLFESNDPTVVKVGEDGQARALKSGETAIVVRAAGHAVTNRVAVISEPVQDYPRLQRRNLIDRFVFSKLERLNIVPSRRTTDSEFLRRVCLDLTGTLPPPHLVREFLASRDPQKRDRLIETLFDSPEYVDYWTFRFADLYRVNKAIQGHVKFSRMYWEWIRDGIEQNKPYDQMARERIAAQGHNGPSRHYHLLGGDLPRPQDSMAEQVRVFFGRRLDCAQCHNHPYEPWSQNQFWGMTAFYGQLTRVGDINTAIAPYQVIIDDPEGHGTLGGGSPIIHPRSKEEVHPQFLDRRMAAAGPRRDPRSALAEWMTANPYFAEATVNRMWGYFFGRGIVDPVDDFRLAHPPTHPALLKALAKDFIKHGYDLQHLMRLIVQSSTYQLSSLPNETNREDRINYSRARPRPLDAEILLDNISQVAEAPQQFGKLPAGTRAIQVVTPDAFPTHFLEVNGQPDRLSIPERKVEPTLRQALHMLAGETYAQKISARNNRIERLLSAGVENEGIIEELYLAAFSRFPTPEERRQLIQALGSLPSRRAALQDFLWVIINSREFTFVH